MLLSWMMLLVTFTKCKSFQIPISLIGLLNSTFDNKLAIVLLLESSNAALGKPFTPPPSRLDIVMAKHKQSFC